MSAEEPTVAKWFTRARKIPQLVGRMPDGRRIWGGPYTLTQICAGLAVFFLGYITMPLWGTGTGFFDAVALITAAGLAIFLFGRLPLGSRNPVHVIAGICFVLSRSRAGYVNGRSAAFSKKPPGTPMIRAYRLHIYTTPKPSQETPQQVLLTSAATPKLTLTDMQIRLAAATQRNPS